MKILWVVAYLAMCVVVFVIAFDRLRMTNRRTCWKVRVGLCLAAGVALISVDLVVMKGVVPGLLQFLILTAYLISSLVSQVYWRFGVPRFYQKMSERGSHGSR